MIKALNHLGIAVKNLDDSLALYESMLGVKPLSIEEVPHLKMRAALFEVSGVHLELLQPTAPDGDIGRFIESRGQGLHHICFEVDDIDADLTAMAEKGIELIDKKGREGLLGKIGFLNPKSTNDVLIELVETR
jgi:methylmalonyl-CoA/ethylmalonyl-CoA epimerase